MSKQLYEEALADVKQLRQLAEDNAKREIMEAVTPRIRQLIESQLMGHTEEITDEVQEKVDHPIEISKTAEPVVESSQEDESDLVEVTADVVEQLQKLVETKNQKLELSVYKLYEAVANCENPDAQITGEFSSQVENLYAEISGSDLNESTKTHLSDKLEECFAVLHGLLENNMNKFKKTLTEGNLTFTIEGLPEDLNLKELQDQGKLKITIVQKEEEESTEAPAAAAAPEEAPAEEAPAEEPAGGEEEKEAETTTEGLEMKNDPIVEIDEKELVAEIRRMRKLAESAAHMETKSAPSAEDDLDEGDYDAGDDDDLLEMKKCAKCGEAPCDCDEDEDLDEGYGSDDDDLFEMKKCACGDPKCKGCDKDDVDADEDDLLEISLDEGDDDMDEAGTTSAQPRKSPSVPTPGARRFADDRGNEGLDEAKKAKKHKMGGHGPGKNTLGTKDGKVKGADWFKAKKAAKVKKGQTVEMMDESFSNNGSEDAELDSLRSQLAETNLFNAKLLYTNKLLQNESLSSRQKARIIEQLDEATSLREVKLVYESLQKTLGAPAALKESANRVIGSSSRPTTSGGTTLAESVEASRWARLAGIK